jgi:excisionase family DNA binding protein
MKSGEATSVHDLDELNELRPVSGGTRAAVTIAVTSTQGFFVLDGVRCRIWEGHTESGIPVQAFIPALAAAHEMENPNELERELTKRETLLTAEEVAKQLKVSVSFVYHRVQNGQIPAVKLGGATRFRARDIERIKHQGFSD